MAVARPDPSAGPSRPGRFVALLRGINVGRAKRVPMAELRELMLALGYSDVCTLLNSGNVVFSAKGGSAVDHAARIHSAVAGNLGVSAQVVTVGASDFAAVVAENPLHDVATDPARLLVAFTQAPAALAALAGLATASGSPDRLAVGSRAAYLWCGDGILRSKLAQSVNRRLGELVTTRNWATVEKIGALLDPASIVVPG
jgi:uncharacterized protein (DUF1697 family)